MFRPIKNFISFFQKNSNDEKFNSTKNEIINDTEDENINSITIKLNEKSNNEIKNKENINNITSLSSSLTDELQYDQNDENETTNIVTTEIDFEDCIDNVINNAANPFFNKNLNTTITKTKTCNSKIEVDNIYVDLSSDCSPIKEVIYDDPLNENSPTKVYVNGNKNYKSLNNKNHNNNDDGEDNNYGEDDNDDDDETFKSIIDDEELIVDEEIIVISPNESNSSFLDSGSDPLALDDCQIEDNTLNLSQNHTKPSIIENSVNDGIICIIDVDNIKETSNIIYGQKNTATISKKTTTNCHTSVPSSSVSLAELSKNATNFDITNVKTEEVNNDEQELRSDGSDSGLGLETSALQILPNITTTINSAIVAIPTALPTTSITTTNNITNFTSESPSINKFPTKSTLKRRLNEIPSNISAGKKTKRSIHFDGVKVYYFPRIQGFACVPSQGGCTLGMGSRHVNYKTFSLTDYAAEQRRVHKQQMQEINPRSSSSDETDSDEEVSEASGSDLDADGSGFLQPVPARQRRALLKAAGIRKIDPTEKDECRAIRTSREFCGCSCRGYCDPDTCSCSQAGIKCQVDRPSFPCGCTRDGCANVVGRIEFNPGRVRTHFIHTIMRLEIENKQKRRNEVEISPSSSTTSSSLSMPMLSYMNNCISDNNLSITSSLTSCTNSNNSLSNIFSVSNSSHIESQQQTYHLHNQNFINSASHYSNIMHNNGISTPFLQENISSQILHDNNQQPQQEQHLIRNHMDLSYPLRDITTENSICNNLMIDFPTNSSNQVFHHDVYNNQSYVGQSYHHNQNLNSTSSSYLTTTAASAYSNYQQNFIPYISSQNCGISEPSIEIHDLATPDDDSNSYINLHPPIANSSRLDAINDLLTNNRNTPPTAPTLSPSSSSSSSSSLLNSKDITTTTAATATNIIDPLPMKPTTVSALSEICNLAPSAQTSTSVVEGTATKITLPALSISIPSSTTITTGKFETTSSPIVDLTNDLVMNIDNLPSRNLTIFSEKDFEQNIEPLDILKDISSIESINMKLSSSPSSSLLLREHNNLVEAIATNFNSDIETFENKSSSRIFEDNDDIQIIGISLDLNDKKKNHYEIKNCNQIKQKEDNNTLTNDIKPDVVQINDDGQGNIVQNCYLSPKANNNNDQIIQNTNTLKDKDVENDLKILENSILLNSLIKNNNENLIYNMNEGNLNSKNVISSKSATNQKDDDVPDNMKTEIKKNNKINNTMINLKQNETITSSNISREINRNEKREQIINSDLNTSSLLLNDVSIVNNKSLNKSSSSSSVENGENLTDIIKESIVETVSA